MISVSSLVTGYHNVERLHGISADIQSGLITAIVGPNGSGKSTLIKSMCGLLPIWSGNVEVNGTDLGSLSRREAAKRISYVPQSRNVPDIDVCRLVLHGRFPHNPSHIRYTAQDRRAVDEALSVFGITELSDTPLRELSGGQRQKVYLAMAYAQDTDVILLDEPVTYLDIKYQINLMEILKLLRNAGKTVVVVLHDLPLALGCCDEIMVMHQGVLCCHSKPQEIVESGILDSVFEIKVRSFVDPDGATRYYCDRF